MKTRDVINSILLFLVLPVVSNAQPYENRKSFGFGFQISEYQQDFGIGVNANTPYVAGNHLALRLRWNQMFFQHVEGTQTTWSPYSNVTLGLIGISGNIGESISMYGEGGILCLFPSSQFSTDTFVPGGYGLFGIEFLSKKAAGYFFEVGGAGTGAKADKIISNPIYSNGLIISAGFRFHLTPKGSTM